MANDVRTKGSNKVTIPKLNLLNKNPATSLILGLLTPEGNKPVNPGDVKRKSREGGIDRSTLERISKITSTQVDANTQLVENVPGAIKTLQILKAAILSPRDLVSDEITYTCESYEDKNNELSALLLAPVNLKLESNYKITEKAPKMLDDILMYKGSYITAILSSSALDNIINGQVKGSMESLSGELSDGKFVSKGYLGDNNKTVDAIAAGGRRVGSLEALMSEQAVHMTNDVVGEDDFGITVTDNESVLKLPQLKMALARNRLAKTTRTPQNILNRRRQQGHGMEDLKGGKRDKAESLLPGKTSAKNQLSHEQYTDIYNNLFKVRDYMPIDAITVPRDDSLTNSNIGAPLIINLPHEAVIPIHLPGDFETRVGSFILLDDDGNPIRTSVDDAQYQNNAENSQATKDAIDGTKGIIEMARQFKEGSQDPVKMRGFQNKFIDSVEKDLIERLINGTYGQTMSIGMSDEIKSLMFSRALRNLRTRVLFVPEESISYMAFDYNRFGIGRSLMERSSLYASLLMSSVIAGTLANIAANTDNTIIDIPLNENDADPDDTVETIVTTHLSGRRSLTSLVGAKNPRDICNIMDEASVTVKTSGHPAYPDVNPEISHEKRNITPPDPDWINSLSDIVASQWGVRPELVSSQNDIKFAVEHINNDALFKKEMNLKRTMFSKMLSELAQKITYKDGDLMDELFDIIMDNKKLWKPDTKKGKEDYKAFIDNDPMLDGTSQDEVVASRILANFINSLRLQLPSPIEADPDEVSREYQSQRQFYESVIADVFPDDVLAYMIEDTEKGDKATAWRQSMISQLMRTWIFSSGRFKELYDLCTIGDDTNKSVQMLEDMVMWSENKAMGLAEYLKKMNISRDKVKEVFDKIKMDGFGDEPYTGVQPEEAPVEPPVDVTPSEEVVEEEFDENGDPIEKEVKEDEEEELDDEGNPIVKDAAADSETTTDLTDDSFWG